MVEKATKQSRNKQSTKQVLTVSPSPNLCFLLPASYQAQPVYIVYGPPELGDAYTPVAGRMEIPWAPSFLRHVELTIVNTGMRNGGVVVPDRTDFWHGLVK